MKYNYVIFATDFELYKYTFQDVKEMDNVQFYKDVKELFNPIEKIVYRILFNEKLNRWINMPFKKKWNKIILKKVCKTHDTRETCFIWFWHFQNIIENGFIEYSRKIMPGVKHIFYFTDCKNLQKTDLQLLKDRMDIVGIYDKNVALQNGFVFLPNVYSSSLLTLDAKEEEYDICFIGADKGRKAKIEKIAKKCMENNLNIAFYLVDPSYPDEKRNGIYYRRTPLSYLEILEIEKKSKCLLELKIPPYNACTLRVQEAIVFNKKLITDNKNVYEMPCCEESKAILVFEDIDDLDVGFVKSDNELGFVYQDEFSPKTFLERIEQLLFA